MKVALTFDDGPSEHTTRILNTLQVHGGRVTFFVLGNKIDEHKGKIFRAWQMGSEVICHAWDHTDFTTLTKKALVKKQLQSTNDAIAAITGRSQKIFRPPYGRYSEKLEIIVRKLGFSMVNWSLNSKDCEQKDADIIYSTIMNEGTDGDIVLCHDIFEHTAEAMSRIIPDLISRGVELVTVSELLLSKYGKFEPGRMYTN